MVGLDPTSSRFFHSRQLDCIYRLKIDVGFGLFSFAVSKKCSLSGPATRSDKPATDSLGLRKINHITPERGEKYFLYLFLAIRPFGPPVTLLITTVVAELNTTLINFNYFNLSYSSSYVF